MNIAGLQFDIAWENKRSNFEKVSRLVEAANLTPGTVLALPELFAVGFTMDTERLAEDAGGETELFLSNLARKHHLYVVGGVLGRSPSGRGLNQSVAFSPDGAGLARYTKMQPFVLGGEANHYDAGRSQCCFKIGDVVVSLHICYDLRFPEVFRPSARAGAELYIVIASWPNARLHHWVRLLQARAIENQSFVLGVNRCGSDPMLNYSGRTLISDPHGEIVADAADRETVIQHAIDLPSLRQYRQMFPALRDIRSDIVSPPLAS